MEKRDGADECGAAGRLACKTDDSRKRWERGAETDMWVTTEADLALARLARRYSVTKREMLERLVVRADAAIVRRLDPDSAEWDAYFRILR